MKKTNFKFEYEVYDSIDELNEQDAKLIEKARKVTKLAYAPYSHFHVGAAAILSNGKIITGTNQENASYPVTICAERSLLSAASSLYPNASVQTMAISYHNQVENASSLKPISPCGMCRQSIMEYEVRANSPIRIILSGIDGKIFIINTIKHLLPLSFTSADLK
ncbi:MAG: cytidine deaminase [Chitinophagaceae bacterium]|nr:cytidine deaminase [Chitinophagaceae bacterium]